MADDTDLDILAWTMLGEAAGEGAQGMADVGHVILNRLNNGRYGSSIQDVALANKQFSTWNSGAGGNDPKGRFPKSSPAFQRARQIAEQVVAGTIAGPPGKPLDYHAPSVNPYWASSKDGNGTFTRNGHVFYPSVPVPPGSIPNTVGTQLDTQRSAPTPAMQSPGMSASRAAPRLPQPRAADLDLLQRTAVTPGIKRDGNGITDPADIVLWKGSPYQSAGHLPSTPMAPKVIPPMPVGVAQSYAGQDRSPPSAPRPPAMPMAVAQSYAGQDRSPAQSNPYPASVEDRVTARNTALPPINRLPAIAPPSPPSRVAPTPAIWSTQNVTNVASLPTGPAPARSISNMAALYASGGPTRPMPQVAPPKSASDLASIYSPGGPTRPVAPNIPDRLLPSLPPANFGGMTTAQVSQIGTDLAGAPTPLPRPTDFPQVGTQLSVMPPMPQMPPMPMPRPNIASPLPQMPVAPPKVAPVPQRRPQSVALQAMGMNGARPLERPPLRITVSGSNTITAPPRSTPPMSVVQHFQSQGMSPAQAYEAANRAAASTASQSATKGYTTIKSNDGRTYDRTTGTWI